MAPTGPTIQRAGDRRAGGRGIAILLLLLAAVLIGAGTAPHWLDDAVSLLESVSGVEQVTDAPDEPAYDADGEGGSDSIGSATDVDPDARRVLDDLQLAEIVDAYNRALDGEDYTGALRQARLYIDGAPGLAYGYVMRGYAQWLRGRCDLVIPDMTRAITLEPAYPYAYWVRASCLFSRGNVGQARSDLLNADSHATEARELQEIAVLRGWIAYAEGDFPAARAIFRLAGAGQDGIAGVMWLAHARGGREAPELLEEDRVVALGSRVERVALDVYAGRREPGALLDLASDEPRALFYLAQLCLLEGDDTEAGRLLDRYVSAGFSTDVEHSVARRQLAALR